MQLGVYSEEKGKEKVNSFSEIVGDYKRKE